MTLDHTHIEFYRKNGYLIVTDVLDADRLSRCRACIDGIAAEAASANQGDERFDLESGHSLDAPRIFRINAPDRFYPEFRELVSDPVITGILEPLIGSNIRLNASKLNMKPPRNGAPVEWHQDWAFYPHTNQDLLAVGVLLDDMDEENGPLLVVPGSHKGPIYDHHIDGIFSGAIDRTKCDIDFASAVPLVAKAGSVTVHHVRMIHGSGPNLSRRGRRLFLMEFAAADAWPLMGLSADFDEYNARIVAGSSTLVPRMEAVPVRVPVPDDPDRQCETVYQYHRALKNRYFEWPD
ncbi:MAG: phytanoyl-CoA dioxygenase family protein [Proteobacteria bacterium]|nr:phytanoyl-CoA dioxygenase family protein [Pseudomonadota bacterium]